MASIKTLFARFIVRARFLIGIAAACKVANADMKKVEDLRHYYRDHGLDFFGELIAEGEDEALMLDEQKPRQARAPGRRRPHARAQPARGPARDSAGPDGPPSCCCARRRCSLTARARPPTSRTTRPGTSKLKTRARLSPREHRGASERSSASFASPSEDGHRALLDRLRLRGPAEGSRSAYALLQQASREPVSAASPLVGDALLAQSEIDFDKRVTSPRRSTSSGRSSPPSTPA